MCSSARLRVGPMPGISCKPASRMSRLRRVRCEPIAKRCASSRRRSHEIEHRVARRQPERLATGHEEGLAAGIAVQPLGDGDERHVGDAERRRECRARH